MSDYPSLIDHILIWIFGIIFPFISGLQSEKLRGSIIFNEQSRRRLYLGNSIMLFLSGSTILITWFIKQRNFSILGFSKSFQYTNTSLIILGLFIIAYVVDLLFSYKKAKSKKEISDLEWFEKSSFLPEYTRELPLYILLCACAGIFEEIIYRGFIVSYFLPIQQSDTFPFLALFAPSILFSLAHYYQGWISVLKIFIFSTLLSWIFISSKSIYINMIIHFLIDLTGGILMLKSKQKKTYQHPPFE